MDLAAEPSSYLVFSETLKPGDTKLTKKVPDNFFLYGNHRNFRLSVLRIKPDFFDKEAHNLSLNPRAEEDHLETFGIELKAAFGRDYLDGCAWEQKTNGHSTAVNLREINEIMAANTKVGAFFPHVVFDWVSSEFLDEATAEEKLNPTAWHVQRKDVFWPPGDNIATNFNEATHLDAFPPSMKNLQFLNHMRFPKDMEDDDFDQEIRIRMHIGPNVSVVLSSESMISYLRLPPVPRGAHNQLFYHGRTFKSTVVEGEYGPERVFRQGQGKHKLKVILNQAEVSSGVNFIQIAKKHFRDDPSEVAAKVGKFVREFGRNINVRMDVKYNAETKRFSFEAAGSSLNGPLSITANIEPALAEKMGFGLVGTLAANTKAMLPPPQDREEASARTSTMMEIKAKALAYDVGMIAVTHDNRPNRQTSQFQDAVVGVAWPSDPGIWTTEWHQAEFGSAPISFWDKHLELSFHRFGEDGRPAPLDCPVNLCVQGIFVAEK